MDPRDFHSFCLAAADVAFGCEIDAAWLCKHHHNDQVLVRADGYTVRFSRNVWGITADRVRISCVLPKTEGRWIPHNAPRLDITCAMGRGPEAVGNDVQRRLFPVLREWHAKAQQKQMEEAFGAKLYERTVRALHDALGEKPWSPRDGQTDVSFGAHDGRFSGRFEVVRCVGRAPLVTLDLHGLSPNDAASVARVLAAMLEAERKPNLKAVV